jgi:hypothetical protein
MTSEQTPSVESLDYASSEETSATPRIALWQVLVGSLAIGLFVAAMMLPLVVDARPGRTAQSTSGWEITSASIDAVQALLRGDSLNSPGMVVPALLGGLFALTVFFWVAAIALRPLRYWLLFVAGQFARVGVTLSMFAAAAMVLTLAWEQASNRGFSHASYASGAAAAAFILLWAATSEIVCNRESRVSPESR